MRSVLSIAMILLAAACAAPDDDAGADLVLRNADIRTMAADMPAARAICVDDGIISFVGDEAGALSCVGAATRVIDLGGKLVLPGFIDTHTHIFGGSISEQKVNLSLADTMEKLVAALRQMAADDPGDGLIYARGWQNHLFPPEGPRATMLDEIFGPRPVILGSVDGHSTWFSTRALELGGATAETPDPQPGVSFFERDATGALLGTAREGAGSFIVAKLVSRTPADYEAAFLRWLPRAAASGLTTVFDAGMGAPDESDAYELLAKLEEQQTLTLRVFASTADRGGEDDPAARLVELRETYKGPLLTPLAVKLFADGVPEAHTAFLTHDYIDRPGFRGEPMTAPDRLNALIARANELGVQSHTHAIGGAAVTMTLDAIEAAQAGGRNDLRHVVAHMDLVEAADVPRFAALGAVPQTSIQWATRDPSFDNIAGFVGVETMEAAYPVKTLIEAGARQTFGADWPASAYLSTFEPLTLIEIAVTRRLPGRTDVEPRNEGEALTVEQAVRAMTADAARQLHAESRIGALEAGKEADLIVLDRNIFEIDPSTIHEAKSTMTLVGGRVVHARAGAP